MAFDTWGPVVTLNHFGFVVPTLVSQQLGREQSWGRTWSPSSQQGTAWKSGKKRLPMVRPVELWFEPLA